MSYWSNFSSLQWNASPRWAPLGLLSSFFKMVYPCNSILLRYVLFSVAFLCSLIQEICSAGYSLITHCIRVTAGGYTCWQNARAYVYNPQSPPVLPSWSVVAIPSADACPDQVHPVKPSDLYVAKLQFCADIEYMVVSIGWDQVCEWHQTLLFEETVVP